LHRRARSSESPRPPQGCLFLQDPTGCHHHHTPTAPPPRSTPTHPRKGTQAVLMPAAVVDRGSPVSPPYEPRRRTSATGRVL